VTLVLLFIAIILEELVKIIDRICLFVLGFTYLFSCGWEFRIVRFSKFRIKTAPLTGVVAATKGVIEGVFGEYPALILGRIPKFKKENFIFIITRNTAVFIAIGAPAIF